MRINFHYFGLKGMLNPRIICSRNVVLRVMKGKIVVNDAAAGRIKIGFGIVGVFNEHKQSTVIENRGTIIFNGLATIGSGSAISCQVGAVLEFGSNFTVTASSTIICSKKISIGSDVLISWESLVMDTDFHSIVGFSRNEPETKSRPILIGNHVWICCKTIILKGVSISNDIVVAAGSTVTKSLDEQHACYASNRLIRKFVKWC